MSYNSDTVTWVWDPWGDDGEGRCTVGTPEALGRVKSRGIGQLSFSLSLSVPNLYSENLGGEDRGGG